MKQSILCFLALAALLGGHAGTVLVKPGRLQKGPLH
jgi:hypothetical protein